MKSDQILDAVGLINEEAVLDAREYRRPRSRHWVRLCAAVAAAVLMSSTAMAAWMLLRPAQVPEQFHDDTLSGAFDSEDAVNINASATSGGYTFTLMAIVSGEGLSNFGGSAAQVQPERTYAVLAIQNADGSPIPEEQEFDITNSIMVTPLIRGLAPWQYNIASMGGSFSQALVDGVAYRLVECDDIMAFADRGLYVGVCGVPFVMRDTFLFDEATGEIGVNPEFQGASAVFELPIDPSLGDPERAEEYLAEFEARMQPVGGGSAGTQAGGSGEPQLPPEVQELVDQMQELRDNADWESMVPVEDSYRELTPDADGYLCYDYPLESGNNAGFTMLAELIFERFEQGEPVIHLNQAGGSGTDLSVWAVRLTRIDDNTVAAMVVVPK